MIKFGTGGWRAVIGEDFICYNIRRVAKGICLLMKEENKTDKQNKIIGGRQNAAFARKHRAWQAALPPSFKKEK